jgi:hypothetical protein
VLDFTIFYPHGGQAIPAAGIIGMGNIDSGVDALRVADPLPAYSTGAVKC